MIILISIQIKLDDFNKWMQSKKGKMRIAFFSALVKSTALARETVIENIKGGMGKGLGWKGFASSTIARKSKRGRSLIGLVDSGSMFNRVHESHDALRLEGKVFPGVNYNQYHEKGTKRMPARKTFAPVPKQINRRVEEIFKQEIRKGLAI